MKTAIYNLIILDESGSMGCVKPQTISGCNETLNTIRSAQEHFAATQEHFVSIFLFQSNDKRPSHYIIKNAPINAVLDVNAEQYNPWGGTPLYDAVGSTVADLKAIVKEKEMAIGNVTIITDGMENSSHHYTQQQVAKMIDVLKECGWSFNFIGANIDVQKASSALNIDNYMKFEQSVKGMEEMRRKESDSRMNWFRRTNAIMADEDAAASNKLGLFAKLKESASNYFEDKE